MPKTSIGAPRRTGAQLSGLVVVCLALSACGQPESTLTSGAAAAATSEAGTAPARPDAAPSFVGTVTSIVPSPAAAPCPPETGDPDELISNEDPQTPCDHGLRGFQINATIESKEPYHGPVDILVTQNTVLGSGSHNDYEPARFSDLPIGAAVEIWGDGGGVNEGVPPEATAAVVLWAPPS